MNKKDVLEIKKRMTRENCTFTRMCGCYVDADKNIVAKNGGTFLNLDDEELFKYLNSTTTCSICRRKKRTR